MKRTLLLVVITIAAAASLHAQAAPDAAELTKLLNEFLAGAGSDAAVHERFWADDLIYTRSAGVRTNKAEIMKGFKNPAPAAKPGDPVAVYTAEDILIHQYGDTAVVAFRLVITTTKADGTKTIGNNLNTGVFVKRKGEWRAVAWQSTVIPKSENITMGEPQSLPNTPQNSLTLLRNPPGRTYLRGTRGRCYYLNPGGKKVYVDRKFCN